MQALTKSFGWTSRDSFQQHDVQELARVLFDALERSLIKTPNAQLVRFLDPVRLISVSATHVTADESSLQRHSTRFCQVQRMWE
jgi:hypothetical protein